MLQIAIGEDCVLVRTKELASSRCIGIFSPDIADRSWHVRHGVSWEDCVKGTTIIDVPDEALEMFFQFLQKWR